ncbi:ribonuclease E/G [Halobacillus mangrovi]|uniref:ribonuclease E/G n=1 Tax=Halobacillus mangrovi TaxID=402384 RepID=UPI003D99E214
MRKIIIHTKSTEKTGLVLENQQICEYMVDRPGRELLSGSIFVGKVENIHRGMQAAFIDIGEEKNAFLKRDQIPWAKEKIEQTVQEGQTLLVQVIREAVGEKGAQVTTDLTLPGLYCIYQPLGRKISVSKKLGDDLSEFVKAELEAIVNGEEGGIVRTAAGNEKTEVVIEEFRLLRKLWREQMQPIRKKSPQPVWRDHIIPDQLIRKFPISSLTDIIVDEVEMGRYIKERYPSVANKISWVKEVESILPSGINELQEALIQPVVKLENGVELVIEPTEAMTVIDVNSHRFKGKSLSDSQAFEVNTQAAKAISKQIRLRNHSGIILVDFLNMKNPSLEKKLVDFMRKQTREDLTKSNVMGMTRLGLMELTRKRDALSSVQVLSKPCLPAFDSEAMVYRMERELLAYSSHPAEAILIAINPQLYEMKKRLLSSLISSKIPQELFVRQDADVSDYQIELEGSENMVLEAIHRRKAPVDNLF